jgi:hypothetical protein
MSLSEPQRAHRESVALVDSLTALTHRDSPDRQQRPTPLRSVYTAAEREIKGDQRKSTEIKGNQRRLKEERTH